MRVRCQHRNTESKAPYTWHYLMQVKIGSSKEQGVGDDWDWENSRTWEGQWE